MEKIFELKKKLEYIKMVYSNHYELSFQIIDALKKATAEILEQEWADRFYQSYKELNLTNRSTWTTYDSCIDFNFHLENDSLICTITVWEGDLTYGEKTQQRWTAKVKLPDEFLLFIEREINRAFYNHASYEFEKFLASKKQAWIVDFTDKILSSAN